MAPNPRVKKAFMSMKELGISEEVVKPVLKGLLKVYDKNWELIEDDNYRVLIDAIFEEEDAKLSRQKKKCNMDEGDLEEEAQMHDELEQPLTRLHKKTQESGVSTSPSGSNSRLAEEDQTQDESERPFKRLRKKTQEGGVSTSPSGSNPTLAEEAQTHDELERPLKRLRKKTQEGGVSTSPSGSNPRLDGFSLKRPKVEDELPESYSGKQSQDVTESPQTNDGSTRAGPEHAWPRSVNLGKQPASPQFMALPERSDPPQPCASAGAQVCAPKINAPDSRSSQICPRNRGKEVFSPQLVPVDKRSAFVRSSPTVHFKEPNNNPGIVLLPKKKVPETCALITPKDEPFTDDVQQYIPIQVIHPGSLCNGDSSIGNDAVRKSDGQDPPASQSVDREHESDGVLVSSNEKRANELVSAGEESPPSLEIASSPSGAVRISLSFNSAPGKPDFHMQGSEFLERISNKYLQPYRIIDPAFSLPKLLTDMCQGIEDIVTESIEDTQEGSIDVTSGLELMGKSTAQNATSICLSSSNGSVNMQCSPEVPLLQLRRNPSFLNGLEDQIRAGKIVIANGCGESDKGNELEDPEFTNSHSLVVVPQCQLTSEDLRSIHDSNDLTKGEEKVQISWVNEVNSELPPSFHYIPKNLVFQNALVKFTLSSIGNENCCSSCFGDCLSSPIVCVCARKTGGAFAYTLEGLVRDDFLEECISLTRASQRRRVLYCQECPAERSKKDDIIEQCKGHLERKFIKECWSKCGCNKQCGNRVVQRGINRSLQVFLTPEGKGWGLRTLEDLPRGAFVCEYIGEILTTMELHARSTVSEKLVYPAVLDADWGTGDVEDEKALCLDAASYGNVGRFINHRCLDANLVEIPVEVETPDHHYYHLAFFTTRKVDALEELTWDYGIDFDDQDHPAKAFRCRCGSKYCRVMKRSNRSRSASVVS